MNLVYRRFWPWNSCFCVTSSLQFCTIVPYLQSETQSPFEFVPPGLHPRVGHTPAGQLWWWWRWWFGLEFGESLRVAELSQIKGGALAMFWKLVLQMVICTCQSLSLSSCHIRGQVWCQGQFCVWCSERDSEFICVGPGSIQSHLWYHIALLKPHHVEMGRKSNMQIESLHHWPLKTSSSTKDHKRMMDLRVLVEPRVAETSPWGWKHHGILSALWLSLQGTSGLRCLSTERTFMRVRYGGCSSNLSLNIHNSGIDVTVEQRTEQTESTQPWFSIRFSSMFPLHITSAKVLATFLHKN